MTEEPLNLDGLRSSITEAQTLELQRSRARSIARAALAGSGWQVPGRRRAWLPWIGGSLLAAGAAAAVLFLVVRGRGDRERPLTFEVAGGAGQAVLGAELRATAVAPLPVGFSDGSRFTLESGARMQVTETSPAGARLVLASGRVRASVVHGRRSQWRVSAGPFAVTVTGTKFSVDWDPTAGAFTLEVTEGSVIAEGALLRGGRPVTAGHRVRVSLGERSVRWDDEIEHPVVEVAPPAPAVEHEAPGEMPRAPAALRSRPAWKELVLAERYTDAIRHAELHGFPRVCRETGSSDLLLLGNAARYAGSFGRATEAFTAVRRRFPATPDAAVAAFSLGRMASDNQHQHASAARWLETYLREQPTGELAREAAGRLVEARAKEGDREAARTAAARYMAQYPNGPHSGLARSILSR